MSRAQHHVPSGNIQLQNIYPPMQASTQPAQASTQPAQASMQPAQASTHHRGGQNQQNAFIQAMKEQLKYVPKDPFNDQLVPIFRLPEWYHETNKHLYEPKMVAIGPFHNGKDSLRAMEDHKWCSLKKIIDHNANVSLEAYFRNMMALEQKARDCYSEYVRMESLDFVRMLLLDGCFIIDYFEKLSSHLDAICNVGWAKIHLYSDLFLLENQIPFFVIHELITLRNGGSNCNDNCQLINLFRGAFQKIFSPTELYLLNIPCKDIHHLLQLYYISIVPPEHKDIHNVSMGQDDSLNHRSRCCLPYHMLRRNKAGSVDDHQGNNISCVSELREAGITFRKRQHPTNMFDISFGNGIMEMPFLKVEDTHKVILWNMVAFEQSQLHLYKSQILSSYLALMDSLINTEKDVAILERGGVIENFLQTDEDAAALFNQFAKSFVIDYSNHHYKHLFLEIKQYSKSGWHKNIARLKHDYFRNPWTTISVLAAGMLLLLTAAQTYYAAKSAN